MRVLLALGLNGDGVANLDLEGRYVHLSAVDLDVAVVDKLPRLTAGCRKSGPVNDVVEPLLKHEQEIFARDAFLPSGLLEIVAELLFENEIYPLNLLLLAKLLAVSGRHLSTSGPMLARRICSALFDRARRLKTSVAF